MRFFYVTFAVQIVALMLYYLVRSLRKDAPFARWLLFSVILLGIPTFVYQVIMEIRDLSAYAAMYQQSIFFWLANGVTSTAVLVGIIEEEKRERKKNLALMGRDSRLE